jgi:hypothetical protein
VLPNGELVAGGNFTEVDGLVSACTARWQTTCPARADVRGAGCINSRGIGTLSAVTLPWDATIYRARAENLPLQAFAVSVYGFLPFSTQLAGLLPMAHPDCQFLVTPAFYELEQPVGGTVDTQIYIPTTPSLISLAFHHQVVSIEVDALGILGSASTNALDLTVGSY